MKESMWLALVAVFVAILTAGVQRCGEQAESCTNVMGQCYNLNVARVQ